MIEAIFIGIIGARLYYVIFNFNYYINNPKAIFNIRDGGLAIYGGLIFCFLFILLKCKIKEINVYNFLDYIIPYVPFSQSFGRWGNFFNIEAYGYETNNIFRMGIHTPKGYLEVHPVFLYEYAVQYLKQYIRLMLRVIKSFVKEGTYILDFIPEELNLLMDKALYFESAFRKIISNYPQKTFVFSECIAD